MWVMIVVTLWAGDGGAGAQVIRAFTTQQMCEKFVALYRLGEDKPERIAIAFCAQKPVQ